MPRACTVCSSPKAEQINRDLTSGMAAALVASKYRIGDSSVRRHSRTHLSASLLQELRASEHLGSTDLIERLAEAVDDVAAVRSAALLTGNHGVVLRAAAATQSLIESLMDRVGIDSLETARLLREGDTFARAVARATAQDARVGTAVAEELSRLGDNETADALRTFAARHVLASS
jgi:hypothetical protein